MHYGHSPPGLVDTRNLWDRWILSRLSKVVEQTTKSLEKYAFHETALLLYDFFWHDYCDWYLEVIKQRLYNDEDVESREEARRTAGLVLDQTLRLFHPFMPFITEEIWQELNRFRPTDELAPASIVVSSWPEVEQDWIQEATERDVLYVQELIGAIRGVRADFRVHPTYEMTVYCQVGNSRIKQALSIQADTVKSLCRSTLEFPSEEEARPAGCASGVLRGLEFYIPLSGLIDLKIEAERLSKERTRIEQELEKVKKRLSNKQFVQKAPAAA